MPTLHALETGNMDDLKRHLSYYFNDIADGMSRDERVFEPMEYINFVMLDILTSFYYSIPPNRTEDKEQFINNIKNVADGLERNSEKCNGGKMDSKSH